jgi:hypothetical protein
LCSESSGGANNLINWVIFYFYEAAFDETIISLATISCFILESIWLHTLLSVLSSSIVDRNEWRKCPLDQSFSFCNGTNYVWKTSWKTYNFIKKRKRKRNYNKIQQFFLQKLRKEYLLNNNEVWVLLIFEMFFFDKIFIIVDRNE